MLPYYQKNKKVVDVIHKLTEPILKKNGFYYANLLLDWQKIVGAETARVTTPLNISFKKGEQLHAHLTLQVEPAAALIMGFQKGLIIQKITAFYGKPLIKDIYFKQQSFRKAQKNEKKDIKKPIEEHVIMNIKNIQSTDLENALQRLGESVYGKSQ